MTKAKARGANFIDLFSNSPMWWMCINHNPSGADNGANDNLQDWNYQQHAVYLATVAKYAQDHWGITFNSVEPFNEPSGNWWVATGTQEGCHFARPTQAAVVPFMRSELNSRGLTGVRVAASDECTYDDAVTTWNGFSSTIQGDIGQVNVHGYQGASGRRDVLYTDVKGKRLWNSEYGDGDGSGITLASNLNLDFRWLHNTAWVYWQALDESAGWALIQCNPNQLTVGAVNPKYYVFAQYSRHIRQGMTIIDGGEGNTIAALDSANKKLIIVTTNYGTAQTISYDLSSFTCSGPITRWVTQTNGSQRYVQFNDITLSGTTFKSSFPVNTVQTFEIQNCVPK